jgi:hypothetical protein
MSGYAGSFIFYEYYCPSARRKNAGLDPSRAKEVIRNSNVGILGHRDQ